jgi:hypothetical protein
VDDKQTVVKHVASWLKKDWVVNEIEQLKQDAEEAHVAECTQEAKANKWYESYERKNEQFNKLAKDFEDRIADENTELRDKCMIYLSLISEYETVLNQYCSSSMVRLTTTKINELRQRGGFSV